MLIDGLGLPIQTFMGQYFYAGSRTYEANRGMRNRDKPSQLEYQLYTS